jgi:hypothetical protein
MKRKVVIAGVCPIALLFDRWDIDHRHTPAEKDQPNRSN